MDMRPFLGLLAALALLLTACGGGEPTADDASEATSATSEQSGPSGPSSTAPGPDGPVDAPLVALVSKPAVGGEVTEQATVLDDDAAVEEYANGFGNPEQVAGAITQAITAADVPEGDEVLGAVVDIGCNPPKDVTVERVQGEVTITAVPVKQTHEECFAAVTTIALVALDEAPVV